MSKERKLLEKAARMILDHPDLPVDIMPMEECFDDELGALNSTVYNMRIEDLYDGVYIPGAREDILYEECQVFDYMSDHYPDLPEEEVEKKVREVPNVKTLCIYIRPKTLRDRC